MMKTVMMMCVAMVSATAMAAPPPTPVQPVVDQGQDTSIHHLEGRADVNDVVDAGQDASLGDLEEAKAKAEVKLRHIQAVHAKDLRSIRARLDSLNALKLSKTEYERLSKAARAADTEEWKGAMDDLEAKLTGMIRGLETRIEALEEDVEQLKTTTAKNTAGIETLMKRKSANVAPVVQTGFSMYTGGSVQGGIELTVGFTDNTFGRIGGSVGTPFSGEEGLTWSIWASVMHRIGIIGIGGTVTYGNFDTVGAPGVKAFSVLAGPQIDFTIGAGFRAFINGGIGYGAGQDASGPSSGFAVGGQGGFAWDAF